MIRRSLPVAMAAILVSLFLHVAGFGWRQVLDAPEAPPVTQEAPLPPDTGRNFEDLVEPLPEPQAPEPAEAPQPPDALQPDEMPTSQAMVASDNPENVIAPDGPAGETGSPDEGAGPVAEEAAEDSGEDSSTSDIAMIAPDAPETTPQPPEGAQDAAPGPAEETAETETPPEPEAVTPETDEAALAPTPDAPDTVIAAEEPDLAASAVTRSLRPPSSRPTAEQLGVPEEPAAQASRAPSYESPLTAYKRDGTDLTALGRIGNASPGDFGGSGGQGNAGTTNYAGRVLMQLNRGPRVDNQAKGMARVYFQINPDGTLGWIRILDSSGASGIRSAAQAQVRSAAPFPRPPGGRPEKLVFVYRNR
ncbi:MULTISPECIES: TonB family protein [unclassified Roseovarius]|uniref:TonB family protein n=1 Tax=unclassified Roseovarius TaxID=2614913 RepID=UPI00273FCE85|nr:TonB family protein [Roseovarius sp. MMSF_3350]